MSPAKDEDGRGGTTAAPPPSPPSASSLAAGPPLQEKPALRRGLHPPALAAKSGQAKPAKRKILDSYCISLTQRARRASWISSLAGSGAGAGDPILNRPRRTPWLIGEPGVGKTASRGLPSACHKDVPTSCWRRRSICWTSPPCGGTQFRGQCRSRMKGLIEEIRKLGNQSW